MSALYPRSSALKVAQHWLQAACTVTGLACFLAGEYASGPRLAVAPVPAQVPASQVARTPAQRRSALRSGAAFVWCTIAALAGTSTSTVAARAAFSVESL
eukprot:4481080-Pleurochrysis_carterae.AAC.1